MKRLTSIELCACILGIVLIVVGLDMVIWPHASLAIHFTNGAFGANPRREMEAVTPFRARIYGVLAIFMGVGIVIASTYRGNSKL